MGRLWGGRGPLPGGYPVALAAPTCGKRCTPRSVLDAVESRRAVSRGPYPTRAGPALVPLFIVVHALRVQALARFVVACVQAGAPSLPVPVPVVLPKKNIHRGEKLLGPDSVFIFQL